MAVLGHVAKQAALSATLGRPEEAVELVWREATVGRRLCDEVAWRENMAGRKIARRDGISIAVIAVPTTSTNRVR